MDTKTVQISVGYDTITFGEYDSHFEQAIQKEDDMCRIPKNDITVTNVKRSIRTKENTIPKELQEYVQKGSRFRTETVESEAKQKAPQSNKSQEASSETKQSRDKDNENNDDAEQSDPEQSENDNANEAEQRNNANQYIVDCVKFFNQSWQEVKRSNTEFTNNTHLIEHQQSAQFDKLPDLQYEVDIFDTPAATEASDLNPDLIKFSHDPSKDKVTTMLSNNRVDLFQAYGGVTPSWSRDVPGQIASPTDSKNAPWSETLGPQIHVSVEELSFALGELEPFFGTLALYDVKRRLKLSENFHFDINSKQTIELLGPHKGKRDDNPIRNALFSSSYASPDIFLVLIVTKTLQGDEDSAIDPYLKANLKPKEKAKMEGDLKEICQRLGNYRQYFAFSCVQLFDDNNNFMMHENSNDNKTVQRNLVKLSPKGDIFSVINEFEKSKQKLKVIPGRFVVGLEMLPTYSGSALSHSDSSKTIKGSSNGPIPDIIDASLRAVSIPSSIFTTPPNKTLRELREFRQPENRNYPNMSYMNELYLYIDTVNLNNYHGNTSCRNIAVEVKLMENDHNVQAEGIPTIYGRQSSSRNQLASKEVTTVVYHTKKPKYFEEIKIELPPIITSAHHLLITFYHVKCQLKKLKKDEKPEITVGYSCIPLVQNGRVINDDTHSLPVGTVFPPKYRDPKMQDVIKWVDNKKPVFTFRTKLVSTIYTQDSNLNNFLNLNAQQNDDSVFEAVQQIGKSSLHSLIEYFPIIVKKLLLLISEGSPIVAEESLLSLVTVLDMVTQASSYGRYIVETYLQYVLDENHNDDAALPQPSAKPLYHELVRTWYKLIFQKHPRILDTYKYSWFLFGIITKVMILHLNQQGTLDAQTNLFNRFNREFVVDLKKLLLSFVPEIREKYHTSLYLFKGLNVSVALFLRDVLCILPKSDVFQMIYRYSRGLDDNNAVATLVDFKFLFLKIVADHEHYVPCNVPPSPKDAAIFNMQPADIKTALWQRHFIAGLLIDEVERTLSQTEPVIIRTAIESLCFILQKHNYDVRYKDDAVKQQRIATMYFPFLLTVIDNLDVLTRPATQGGYAMSSNDRRTWLICFLYILKGLNVQYIKDWWKLETQKRQLGFFETLLLAIQSFQYNGKEGLLNEQPEEESTSSSSLKDSAQSADDSLSDSGSSFRKKDKEKKTKKDRSSASIPGRKSSVSSVPGRANNNDTKALLENRYMNISSPSLIETPENSSPESGVRKHTELRSWAQNAPRQQHSRTQSTNPTLSNMSIKGKLFIKSPKKEANLCREVALVSINTILQLLSIRDFHNELLSKESVFITKFWGVINTLLNKNQAVTLLESIFYVIAFLLPDFKKPLFRYPNNGICEDLTFVIMKYCNSKLGSLRSHSSAILFLLIQDNFKEVKNFSRMKLQCTIALSKLVGTSDTTLSPSNNNASSKSTTDFEELKGSLQKIAGKSKEKDRGAKGSLGEQVEEMVERLFGVIRDSLKVKQMSWDPERTAELYYQISKGFVDSPDLRVTWLENLANFHNKNNHFEECAQTKLLTAYLVSGYLKLLNNFPADITSQEWGRVFPNLAIDHVLPPAQTLEALEGEICQSSLFSDEGYADLLKQAVGKLKLGSLHESCVEVYQLLLPVFQKKRDYKRQAVCYQDLFVLCHTIVEENQKNQRLFSNYYRVAFFGDKFDDLDGKEFVYKEPSTVRLNEFTDRLKHQFGSRFGHDNIQLLANTKPVIKSELNPTIAYMQIIAVDVCLTPEQLKTRQTLFDRNYNIDKFIFETPFTKSGKAHGDMAEQYKRKTILTVEAVFPYVRKRLLVTKKEVIELTPIETAIELIQRKTLNLKAELSTATPNIKTLQMELQGSLLAQVNAGPLEVCRIFLGDNMTKYDKSHIESLIRTIDEFQVTLLKAIGVNSSLISPEQRILQQELELAYKNFSTEVKNYYSGASPKNDDDDQIDEDEDD